MIFVYSEGSLSVRSLFDPQSIDKCLHWRAVGSEQADIGVNEDSSLPAEESEGGGALLVAAEVRHDQGETDAGLETVN